MPVIVKAKKKDDGTEVEVELPSGYGLRSEIIEEMQESVDKDVGKRIAKAREKALAEALDDAEFRTSALAHWKIDPDAKPLKEGGKPTREQIDALTAEIESTKVKPVMEKLTKAEQRIQNLLGRDLDAAIIRAATQHGVKKMLLKSVDGGVAPIVAMTRQKFGLDEESDSWLVKKGDRFALSAKEAKDGSGQFMGVEEQFETMKANPDYADLFEDQRQEGSNFKKASETTGGVRVVSKADVSEGRVSPQDLATGKVRVQ